ncbi:hypothetical protein EJ06DRAFT_518495 [Trichodelitschia bisporula]|uniref:NTF2 domain-containing protein n=1 Tax=Trichodelitschia bisporula TaxID=703511 RepID=A0A6G1IBH8_9PEZI|nr:hypothetical protein EJ06DRAFT_518495 [Trichodelitschia bisporula]
MVDYDVEKGADEATTSFADAYHSALNGSKDTITTFYVRKNTDPSGKLVPEILWNGALFTDPEEFTKMIKSGMPTNHRFTVQTVDCHILKENYHPDPPDRKLKPEKNMSILAMISGNLRLGDSNSTERIEFNQTVVLVPNLDKLLGVGAGVRGLGLSKRAWLIESQIFRYVVIPESAATAALASMEVE